MDPFPLLPQQNYYHPLKSARCSANSQLKMPSRSACELSELTAQWRRTGLLKSSKLKVCLNCAVSCRAFYAYAESNRSSQKPREPAERRSFKIPANGGAHFNSLKHTADCCRRFQKELSIELISWGTFNFFLCRKFSRGNTKCSKAGVVSEGWAEVEGSVPAGDKIRSPIWAFKRHFPCLPTNLSVYSPRIVYTFQFDGLHLTAWPICLLLLMELVLLESPYLVLNFLILGSALGVVATLESEWLPLLWHASVARSPLLPKAWSSCLRSP